MISLACFGLLLFNFQCSEDEIQVIGCDATLVVDQENYTNLESDFYMLTNANIEGDCLTVSISASGCGPDNWELILVDSGAIAYSLPPQRTLKLAVITNEDWLAVFNTSKSFDLSSSKIDGVNQVTLHIEDYSESLNYSY